MARPEVGSVLIFSLEQNKMEVVSPLLERHFSCGELAQAWGLSVVSIRRMFQDSPGVLKIGATGRRGRRDYTTLRIPASVAAKIYTERTH